MSLINTEEVMTKTALSKSMIYKLTKSKEIPHFHFGGAIRFDTVEIDNWINANHEPGKKINSQQ